ncbi:MAG: hypothetical protein AAGF84_05295 [Planctomycetota bacterium]
MGFVEATIACGMLMLAVAVAPIAFLIIRHIEKKEEQRFRKQHKNCDQIES